MTKHSGPKLLHKIQANLQATTQASDSSASCNSWLLRTFEAGQCTGQVEGNLIRHKNYGWRKPQLTAVLTGGKAFDCTLSTIMEHLWAVGNINDLQTVSCRQRDL